MQVETAHCEIINKDSCVNVNFKTKLDECVDSIVKNEGYTTYNIIKKKICADGGNYLGVLSEIDIKGESMSGYKETAIFCKMMTPDPIDMGFCSLQNVYNVELFVYKELSKVINQIQDEAKIPINERINTVKCYEESYEQALLMDNLTRKGYKTWYRMDVVSLEMAELCIKQLARFHGASFAIKKLKPHYFDNNIKTIKTPFKFTKEWYEFVEKFYKLGLENLDDDLRTRVRDNVKNILDKYPEYLTDTTSQYVLCHGDYRPNNVLIKEKDGRVLDAVPVDYQLVNYGAPLLDFFYFMYMAADYDFRKAHMNHLKNLYYDSLDIYLQNFDISVESVFPRKLLENMYEEKRDYGIMITFLFCPFLFVSEDEEVPDVTKECVTNIEFKLNEKYKQRLECTIQEFIELGVL